MLSDLVVDERDALAERLALLLEGDARQALAARPHFSVALSGGSLASGFFRRLARSAVDWSRTEFFWVDERAVPPEDPESNFGAARSLWLEPASVPASRIHRMHADGRSLEAAAHAYSDELARVLGAPPRLDVALIGVGPDGHIASLFPGHRLLQEETHTVAAIDDSPKPPPRRLTLTFPILTSARRVVVVTLGASKAEVVRESLEDAQSPLPLAMLIRRASHVTVLLDPDAAQRLPRRQA
jgi:6-phosphogluconolactonase